MAVDWILVVGIIVESDLVPVLIIVTNLEVTSVRNTSDIRSLRKTKNSRSPRVFEISFASL
jgi:hypothetical protein